MLEDSTFYAILDVAKDASDEEIKAAYRNAAIKIHPDTNPEIGSSELFLRVQEAYDTLSNPEKRSGYDLTLPPEEISTQGFAIKRVFSKTVISPSENPQLLYTLLEVTPKPINLHPKNLPLNLALVLDRSTSMHGGRMDMVKDNAIRFLRQMNQNDIISIVTFSDKAEVLIPATRLSDLSLIESRISRIQTGGATEIYQGLSAGVAQIRKNCNPGYVNHLILMTDGRTYGDEAECLELALQAAEEGIGISGLGIGHEWNDQFLDKLASSSGGVSMFINGSKDLRQFLDMKFKNFEQVYAERVMINLTLAENIKLKYAFRLYPEAGPLPADISLNLGNLQQTKKIIIMLEFEVLFSRDDLKELNYANGLIQMHIPTRQVPYTRIPMRFNCLVDRNAGEQPVPQVIIQALSQLSLYRMQEKAREEVDAGNVEQASKHLQYLATHLLSKGQRDLAQTVLREADHIQKSKQFSEEGDKRIKYGTRALLLPPGMEEKPG
jgi:Ca-activated chloride channel family protein